MLSLLLLVPSGPGVRAQGVDLHCGAPFDWQKLANLTRRVARRLPRVSEDAPRDIAAALRDLNWGRLRSWQGRIDRPDIDRLMKASVEELRNFSSTARMTRPDLLVETLDLIDTRSASICVEVTANGAEGDGGFGGKPSPAGFGMSANGETFADYARLSMLPVIIAAFGVILKIGHMLLKWYHTVRYSRRSCQVMAEIHIGPYVIPGTITVLGLRGCRFVCGDDESRALLSVVAGSSEMKLLVGSIRLPSSLSALNDTWAALQFESMLTEQLHVTILERSKVRPRYVTLPALTGGTPSVGSGSGRPARQTNAVAASTAARRERKSEPA
ncbi:hypothetical protein ATO3_07270 [Marinibacterium profundimaris]|uniref:Uncharacterized protein n=1 Tax=Marinibacterium profundimaris TaxID=1679460 RepID=A0A225NW45_9RHOB|nr:hypothetical protein ATO3_07270 [Marinibacterium profundimaris]